MSVINVMIADDHPLIVEGLASVLSRYGLTVVGSASEASSVVDTY
ncbi:MAG: DNA-binding response regulator, partial [Aquabacterium sp.]|nr:DNA-binding response regulator [Aquabacterium sp.]